MPQSIVRWPTTGRGAVVRVVKVVGVALVACVGIGIGVGVWGGGVRELFAQRGDTPTPRVEPRRPFAPGALAKALNAPAADDGQPDGRVVEVKGALVKLIERAEIPARQAGTLTSIAVEEGAQVTTAQVLAGIDDDEARLQRQRAEQELQIAQRKAENDVELRGAEEELAVAERDLKRGKDAREALKQAVSPAELDRLQLRASQARLRAEKARHELEVARLTQLQRSTDLELATLALQRRRVVAPFDGIVVETYRHRGEWVEPGEKIMRIIRLDRVRAEGFADADSDSVTANLVGRQATLVVEPPGRPALRFTGKVVFVSPEIDPVNRQTRVAAEFENRELRLQPGMRGTLTIGQ
ncbi:MAG TPA: efflux RND transporter periplasmic adaptor subunit [Pirellulaceae bacterium]|nr:efflux RND transporter periplasmic adaptor subunit [Pirellulaceae bacterium]